MFSILLQTFELTRDWWGHLLCFSLLVWDYQRLRLERACHHALRWIAPRPSVEDSVASRGEKTHVKQMNVGISLLCAARGHDATQANFSSTTTTNCKSRLSGAPPWRRPSISTSTPGAFCSRWPSPSGRDDFAVVHFGFRCHADTHKLWCQSVLVSQCNKKGKTLLT